jgi:hypothetical protein
MEMNVKFHALVVLPSRERDPGTCRTEEWVEFTGGLDKITDGNRTPETQHAVSAKKRNMQEQERKKKENKEISYKTKK